MTQTPKKPKKLLDYALRQMHDAMETVFDYDHDPCFVPNADQLVLFEILHKQIAAMRRLCEQCRHGRHRSGRGSRDQGRP